MTKFHDELKGIIQKQSTVSSTPFDVIQQEYCRMIAEDFFRYLVNDIRERVANKQYRLQGTDRIVNGVLNANKPHAYNVPWHEENEKLSKSGIMMPSTCYVDGVDVWISPLTCSNGEYLPRKEKLFSGGRRYKTTVLISMTDAWYVFFHALQDLASKESISLDYTIEYGQMEYQTIKRGQWGQWEQRFVTLGKTKGDEIVSWEFEQTPWIDIKIQYSLII